MIQTMENSAQNSGLAIIGGGISGLTSALEATEQGVPGEQIHIYEASGRLGGKIRSAKLGDKIINAGAEFIDSNSQMTDLCRKLGVNLIATGEQSDNTFQKPNGYVMTNDEFFKAYAPIARQIKRHKDAVAKNPMGIEAQRLNSLSLLDYMQLLAKEVEVNEDRSWLKRTWDWITQNDNRVDADVLAATAQAYASEVGQPPENINALQFVSEASPDPTRFLASDCGYRVEGGTEKVIDALKAKLEQKGVHIHLNTSIDSVARENGKPVLHFTDPNIPAAKADKLVVGLPTYAICKLKGIEDFIGPDAKQILSETQYTNNVKFTIALKPGTQVPDTNLFSNRGFQCWSSDAGTMTFLANAESLQTQSPAELIDKCLDAYAQIMGKRSDQIFDRTPGNIVFSNPGKSPCYATPRPEQAIALQQLAQKLEQLPNDIGVVGTFIPGPHGQIGFMDCGVLSAKQRALSMNSPEPQRAQWLENILSRQPQPSHERQPPNLPG